jgi:hypothetical protein
MAKETSMTLCLATFFWIAIIVFVLKVVTGIKGVVVEILFFLVSMLCMLIVFASVMRTRCGTAPFGDVLGAVILPWILMFGSVLVLIRVFPGWIQPFSNTFGYLICLIPAIHAQEKLTAILNPLNKSMSKLIEEDTSLMMNEFSSVRYEEIVDKMVEGGVLSKENTAAVEDFGKIIRIKDATAEFIWHLLVGCVAITAAYNNLMNTVCQKAPTAPAITASAPAAGTQ